MAKEKHITRTFTTSEIYGAKVLGMEDGKIKTAPLEPVTVKGNLSTGKAVKILADKYDNKKEGTQFVVIDIHYTEDKYAISEETFLKHAKRVQPAKVTVETEVEA